MSISLQSPYSPILMAFHRLHPRKCGVVQFVSGLTEETEALGRTRFDTSPPLIEIDAQCPVAGSCDILCHELAHLAAGFDEGHGPAWQAAYEGLVAAAQALSREIDDDEPEQHLPT